MSRTKRGSKGCGYDYWSRRHPANGINGHGKDVKIQTHRWERRQARAIVDQEILRLSDPPEFCPQCGRESAVSHGVAWCFSEDCDWFTELPHNG